MPKWKKSSGSRRGAEQELRQTCGDSLAFSSSRRRGNSGFAKVPEKVPEGAPKELCCIAGQRKPCREEVISVEQRKPCREEVLSQRRSCGEEVLNQRRSRREEVLNQRRSCGEEVLNQRRSRREEVLSQRRSCGEEVLSQRRSRREEVLSQRRSCGEEVLSQRRSRREEVLNQRRSCGDEVLNQRRSCGEEVGSLQAHKVESSSSLKATRVTSIRKARVEKFYTKGALLGTGGFGSVFAGTRKSDGLPVALKYARKLEDDEIQLPGMATPLPREVGLLQKVNSSSTHPSVLQLYEWFDRRASYVMAMERPDPCQDLAVYCEEHGGTLGEGPARDITRQLLGALEHCHERGVVHRDVKPQNILIKTDTRQIKLIDFGCGDPLKDTPYTEFSGTVNYQPPEWFAREEFLAEPGTVWSVGVTLYQMVCGSLPYPVLDSSAMQQAPFLPEWLSPGIRDFIGCCLRPRVEDRPTLGQLQLHPWLQQ